VTRSVARSRPRWNVPSRDPALRSIVRSGFDIWTAGTMPQSSPVISAAAVVKARTRASKRLPTEPTSVSSTERTTEPPQ
jgi:hypothetical protein